MEVGNGFFVWKTTACWNSLRRLTLFNWFEGEGLFCEGVDIARKEEVRHRRKTKHLQILADLAILLGHE